MFYNVKNKEFDDKSLLEYIDSENVRFARQREELVDFSVLIAKLNKASYKDRRKIEGNPQEAMEEVIKHYKSRLPSGQCLRDMLIMIQERFPWSVSKAFIKSFISLLACVIGIGLYVLDLFTDVDFSLKMFNGNQITNETENFDDVLDKKVNVMDDEDYVLTGWISVWHIIQPLVGAIVVFISINYMRLLRCNEENENTKEKKEDDPDLHKKLFEASENGEDVRVRLLLKAGAEPDRFKDSLYGKTALMAAADGQHGKVVTRLIEAGADLNNIDYDGGTALHHAVIEANNQDEVVSILIKAGADMKIKDANGSTPLMIAEELERDRNNGDEEFQDIVIDRLVRGRTITNRFQKAFLSLWSAYLTVCSVVPIPVFTNVYGLQLVVKSHIARSLDDFKTGIVEFEEQIKEHEPLVTLAIIIESSLEAYFQFWLQANYKLPDILSLGFSDLEQLITKRTLSIVLSFVSIAYSIIKIRFVFRIYLYLIYLFIY